MNTGPEGVTTNSKMSTGLMTHSSSKRIDLVDTLNQEKYKDEVEIIGQDLNKLSLDKGNPNSRIANPLTSPVSNSEEIPSSPFVCDQGNDDYHISSFEEVDEETLNKRKL